VRGSDLAVSPRRTNIEWVRMSPYESGESVFGHWALEPVSKTSGWENSLPGRGGYVTVNARSRLWVAAQGTLSSGRSHVTMILPLSLATRWSAAMTRPELTQCHIWAPKAVSMLSLSGGVTSAAPTKA
jgi:hypothetical protein